MKVLTLKEATERGLVEHLKKRCYEMDLATRGTNCLSNKYEGNEPIDYIWELVEKSTAELHKRENLGPGTLNEIVETLRDYHGGLELDTRLTDALKREIGASIKDDDPHEDVEPTTGPATMPDHLTPMSLEDLQQKLDATNTAIERTQQKITDAKSELVQHEDRKRAIELTIKHFTSIALALSS